MAGNYSDRIRSYEISIWTLQDRFLSVLKWASMDCKGQIQNPEMTLRDDGTQELSFSIPKYYYDKDKRIDNPMWLHLENQPLEANLHKLKVVFNKGTADEKIFEFLVISVVHDHAQDSVMLTIKAEGLAFHELGKLGYKIALSETNYTNALDEWKKTGVANDTAPLNNIQFWNDLVFKNSDGQYRWNWTYEVRMDWSAFSPQVGGGQKRADVLYEDEYVSAWEIRDKQLFPKTIQSTREKCRLVEVKESNVYNITQTIAEQFGVFCRYEYEHDDNYQITSRKVIYYNNYIKDKDGHIDLTYPYSSQSITRTVDASEVTTKMYVTSIDYNDRVVDISEVDANKSKEDYLLNFDYLYKNQAITEEQHDAIAAFEADIAEVNTNLFQVLDRIRIVEKQLVEENAALTVAKNSIREDFERMNEAQKAYDALINIEVVQLEGKGYVLMNDDVNGYYINITQDGVIPESIRLFEATDFHGGFSKPISSFSFELDDFGNLIRIHHIVINPDNPAYPPNRIYLFGTWDRKTAYQKIIALWKLRLGRDTALYDKQVARVDRLNWYLYGNHGYKFIGDTTDFSAVEYPLAKVWGDPDNPIDVTDIYQSDRVGECRILGRRSEFSGDWTINYFIDWDKELTSPDLYFNRDGYLKQKERLINNFEKMMGPALREGYWNPEGYQDAGDLYKDSATITLDKASTIQPVTEHCKFMWDNEKYYDSETPLIYDVGISGSQEQYVTIDISSILDEIKDRLDDVCFVYASPSVVAAQKQLREKMQIYLQDIDAFIFNKYSPGADYSGENYYNVFINLVCINAQLYRMERKDKPQWNSTSEILQKAWSAATALRDRFWYRSFPPEGVITEEEYQLMGNRQLASLVENQSQDEFNQKFNLLYDLYTELAEKTYAVLQEIDKAIEQLELQKSSLATEEYEALNDMLNRDKTHYTEMYERLMNVEHIETIENNQTVVTQRYGISYAFKAYKSASEQIAQMDKNKWVYYRVGGGCELGWAVISPNYNQLETSTEGTSESAIMLTENDPNDPSTWTQRVPVLIVTGLADVDDDTLTFILSNYYNTINIDAGYVRLENTWIQGDNSTTPFIGLMPPITINKISSEEGEEESTPATGAEVEEQIKAELEVAEDINWNNAEVCLMKILPRTNENTQFLGHPEIINNNGQITLVRTLGNQTITPQENEIVRQFPRFYFDSLKLKYESVSILKDNGEVYENEEDRILKVNEDYYTLEDDRSSGKEVKGVGYYVTLKPHVLFARGGHVEDPVNGVTQVAQKFSCNIIYSLSNIDTAIYLDAIKVAKENAKPKVSYDVELSLLNPEFVHTAYNRLNQIVHINDIDLQLEDVSGYISTITLKLDKCWEDTVEIKNYETKFEDLFSTIVAQTEAMKSTQPGLSKAIQAFTSTGLIDSDVIIKSMSSVENLGLAFDKKGTLKVEDGTIYGLLEDDGGVVAYRGSGIFTAKEKDEEGNWLWNTAITADGINAALLTGGQLDTNKIRVFSGDDLRFQWNGTGIYAYKKFDFPEEITIDESTYSYTGSVDPDVKTASEDIKRARTKNTDLKQYVLYNEDGLSLIGEEGAHIAKEVEKTYTYQLAKDMTVPEYAVNLINNDNIITMDQIASMDADDQQAFYNDLEGRTVQENEVNTPKWTIIEKVTEPYVELKQDVKRVEISWDGLILRNWKNERVFYADPNTGNLILTGRVNAASGTIGGWNIEENALTGGGVRLISSDYEDDKGNTVSAGISLVNNRVRSPRRMSIEVIDPPTGERTSANVYEWHLKDAEGNDATYYSPQSTYTWTRDDGTYTLFWDDLYIEEEYISSVKPKYIYEVTLASNLAEATNEQGDSVVINNNQGARTVMYIMNKISANNDYNDNDYIIVDNERLIFDGDMTTSASWYTTLKNITGGSNYYTEELSTRFVKILNDNDKHWIAQQNPPVDATDNIPTPVMNEELETFSAQASNGDVRILQGQIGPFIITNSSLSGGVIEGATLNNSNKVGSKGVFVSQLFCDARIEGSNIILTRVDGTTVNFNLAATQYVQQLLAAAAQIQLTVTAANGQLLANATTQVPNTSG